MENTTEKTFWNLEIPSFKYIDLHFEEFILKKNTVKDFRISISFQKMNKFKNPEFEEHYKEIFEMNFASFDFSSKSYKYYTSGRQTQEENIEKIKKILLVLKDIDDEYQNKMNHLPMFKQELKSLDKKSVDFGQMILLDSEKLCFTFKKRVTQDVFNSLKQHATYGKFLSPQTFTTNQLIEWIECGKNLDYDVFKGFNKKLKELEKKSSWEEIKKSDNFKSLIEQFSQEPIFLINPLDLDYWKTLIKNNELQNETSFQKRVLQEKEISQYSSPLDLEVLYDNIFDFKIEYLEEKKAFKIKSKGMFDSFDNMGRISIKTNASLWANNMIFCDEEDKTPQDYYNRDYFRDCARIVFDFLSESSKKEKNNLVSIEDYQKVKKIKENFEKEYSFFNKPLEKLKDFNFEMDCFFPYISSDGQAYFIVGKNKLTKEENYCSMKGFKISHQELKYLIEEHPLHEKLKRNFEMNNYHFAVQKDRYQNYEKYQSQNTDEARTLSFSDKFDMKEHIQNLMLLNEIMDSTVKDDQVNKRRKMKL